MFYLKEYNTHLTSAKHDYQNNKSTLLMDEKA